nr:hypothetical protein [uncultured Flavobacterium sp.]
MKKLELTFGIEPEEFFYSTVIEVQSSILLIISISFSNKEFTIYEIKEVLNNIPEIQLKAHLEDLTTKKILVKNKDKYLLNR